jgi:hypothetical protein
MMICDFGVMRESGKLSVTENAAELEGEGTGIGDGFGESDKE